MSTPRTNSMKWLVKREFWEHKGGFFWAPIWVGAIMVLFLTATIATGIVASHHQGFRINGNSVTTINDNGVTNLSGTMTAAEQSDFVHGLASGYVGLAAPLFVTLGFVVFFFCLGALFDDRKDRSVLFWKSLPISDSATVLSKVAMALIVAPLITIVLSIIVSMLSLIVIGIGAAALGLHIIGPLLATPDLYLSPLEVVAMLPVYALWALPTIGWLMMVSAWARTKPFLWAVGVPVLSGILLTWFNMMFGLGWNIGWFWHFIVGRGLLSIVPGSWFAHHPMHGMATSIIHSANGMDVSRNADGMGTVMMQSWQVLGTADLWIGVAIGAAMLYVAIRMRRWRDEG
ncbi:MAG: hypothetical protein ABIT64_04395 [Lysobacteraceae bacterium]